LRVSWDECLRRVLDGEGINVIVQQVTNAS